VEDPHSGEKKVQRVPLEGATSSSQAKQQLDELLRPIHIQNFIINRQIQGKAARTVNLEVTILRNVLNMAIDHKWIVACPPKIYGL
jgi:hypothetical protein